MSADSTRQHQTYAVRTGCHGLSTVSGVTTRDEGDQDPIDPRGYDKAYEVVARRLERRITGGEFGWHAPLPSEPRLSEWYGVSRTTVRSAIEVLIAAGLVERVRGKGTFVTWRPE
jgi:DNA-binding GntR family transcriptional regulator